MSTPVNDGGPAFPLAPCGTGDPRDGMTAGSFGMSLRDYFAVKALQGMMANQSLVDNFSSHPSMAKEAFVLADAMLATRAKGQQ